MFSNLRFNFKKSAKNKYKSKAPIDAQFKSTSYIWLIFSIIINFFINILYKKPIVKEHWDDTDKFIAQSLLSNRQKIVFSNSVKAVSLGGWYFNATMKIHIAYMLTKYYKAIYKLKVLSISQRLKLNLYLILLSNGNLLTFRVFTSLFWLISNADIFAENWLTRDGYNELFTISKILAKYHKILKKALGQDADWYNVTNRSNNFVNSALAIDVTSLEIARLLRIEFYKCTQEFNCDNVEIIMQLTMGDRNNDLYEKVLGWRAIRTYWTEKPDYFSVNLLRDGNKDIYKVIKAVKHKRLLLAQNAFKHKIDDNEQVILHGLEKEISINKKHNFASYLLIQSTETVIITSKWAGGPIYDILDNVYKDSKILQVRKLRVPITILLGYIIPWIIVGLSCEIKGNRCASSSIDITSALALATAFGAATTTLMKFWLGANWSLIDMLKGRAPITEINDTGNNILNVSARYFLSFVLKTRRAGWEQCISSDNNCCYPGILSGQTVININWDANMRYTMWAILFIKRKRKAPSFVRYYEIKGFPSQGSGMLVSSQYACSQTDSWVWHKSDINVSFHEKETLSLTNDSHILMGEKNRVSSLI
jgi:hypothetical protein